MEMAEMDPLCCGIRNKERPLKESRYVQTFAWEKITGLPHIYI